jgi:hypothetical protein
MLLRGINYGSAAAAEMAEKGNREEGGSEIRNIENAFFVESQLRSALSPNIFNIMLKKFPPSRAQSFSFS